MLLALVRLRETWNFTLYGIHIEHGIRPAEESRGDAAAVQALCRELGVSCRVVSIPPGLIAETAKRSGLGIEAAARQYRHRAWRHEARRIKAATVLVAHTRDDALETALMRVLRGSGPAGLAALPAEKGLVSRPLLHLGRADVLRYLEERGVPYRTDSTNQDNQYLRNRVRNRLIPLLDELFPHWKKGLAAMAETQGLTAAFLADEGRRRVVWEQVPGTAKGAGGIALRTGAETFFAQSGIIREEALFRGIDTFKVMLNSAGGDGPAEEVPVRRSSLRLFATAGVGNLDLGFCRIGVKGPHIVIVSGKNQVGEAGFSLLIKEPGIYKLERDLVSGFSLEVRALNPGISEVSPGKELGFGGIRGFYAALPLVLRPGFNGDFIIVKDKKDKSDRRLSLADVRGRREFSIDCGAVSAAVDCRGVAAFIGAGPDGTIQVLCREAGDSGDPSFFMAVSQGSIDA